MLKKKALALALTICTGAYVFGAGSVCVSAESDSGGWEFSGVSSYNLSDDDKELFDNAVLLSYEGSSSFEPTDVIAFRDDDYDLSFAYLCKETPDGEEAPTNWSIVTVQQDINNPTSITSINAIDLTDLKTLDEYPEIVPGSWCVDEEKNEVSIPESVQSAIDSNLGLYFSPTAVIATQIVHGTNYSILSYGSLETQEPRTDLYVVQVYEDLNENAQITSVSLLDIAAYCTPEEGVWETEPQVDGAWEFCDTAAQNITEEEAAVFQEAIDSSYSGTSTFEPTDVIASQIVAGRNYAYLCKETPAGQDSPTNWSIVTVYADLGGNASIVNIMPVEPEAICLIAYDPDLDYSGNWIANSKDEGVDLPEAVQTAINENMGLSLVPTAIIARQAVAGTNYRILAYGTLVIAEPKTDLYIVDVFEGLDGTAEITDVSAFDTVYYVSGGYSEEDEPQLSEESEAESSQVSDEESSEVSGGSPDRQSSQTASTTASASAVDAPATGEGSLAIIVFISAAGTALGIIVFSRKKYR